MYYAPYQRPMGYYNPSIPNGQELANLQATQQYQPTMTQPVSQPTALPVQQSNDMMIWVLNETEAVSYPVAPNNSVTLWDKGRDTVYIKSVNQQGVPSMRILDYTERTAENAIRDDLRDTPNVGGKFVLEKDFRALQDDITEIKEEIESIKAKSRAKKTKSAETEKEDE